MAANAALLDELMGRNRNLAPEEMKNAEVHYDHPDVCKYYLCGFCPHELFRNTRVDIGPCDKIHEDALVTEYKNSKKFNRLNYEEDFTRFVQSLITDIDKRIRRGHQRLQLNNSSLQTPQQNKDEKIKVLTDRINDMLKQAEELGCDGKVEQSQGVMKLVDKLKEERKYLEDQEVSNMPDLKEMEVCGICGAFQVKGDAPQRVEEHITGKQHIGYATLRAYLQDREDEKKSREEEELKRLEERRKKREEEDEERRRRRSRSREGRRDHRRRSRSKDRDRRRRSRERRSHSRERYRRSRSRDRYRRSRSRERSSRSSHEKREGGREVRHRERKPEESRSSSKASGDAPEPTNDQTE